MLILSLAKRPEICLGDHCFSFIMSITRHLRTGFNALFPGDCPLREHAVSWALFHTYLLRGGLLRRNSRLTVDLWTPMERAIISSVSPFCRPRQLRTFALRLSAYTYLQYKSN